MTLRAKAGRNAYAVASAALERRHQEAYNGIMQSVDPQEDIERVAACGPLKVWSVVVSIMGDLLQAPDQRISGRTLNALMMRLGINNQALRVAVHRLRRDGWIVTDRDGRSSNHRLSDQGWAMTEKVRSQIYEVNPTRTASVHLIMGPATLGAADFGDAMPQDTVFLSSRTGLVVGTKPAPEGFLSCEFAPDSVPDWVAEALVSTALRSEYTQLAAAVAAVLARPLPAAIADQTALRLVILHHWRRLRLRHGILADVLLPADWEGAQARAVVMQALARFARPDLVALAQSLERAGEH